MKLNCYLNFDKLKFAIVDILLIYLFSLNSAVEVVSCSCVAGRFLGCTLNIDQKA